MPAPEKASRPDDIADCKALEGMPSAPLESTLQKAGTSRPWSAEQLRASRAKHPLNSRAEAIAQMRRFRDAMDQASASPLP